MNRIVFGTLRRRWLRTLLVGLSTLIAFMLLGFFLAIRHGFAVGPMQVGADLVLLEPVGGTSGLPLGSLSTIRAFPGVRTAVGIDGTGMRYGADLHPMTVEGLSPHAFLQLSGVVQLGELARPAAQTWLADPIGALVSQKAAQRYSWEVGQTIILHTLGSGPPRDLTVHIDGVLAKSKGVSPTGEVNLHLDYFRRWSHSDTVGFMFIQVRHPRQADAVAQAIQLKFANSTTPVTTQSFKSLLQGMAERLADVNALTSVVIVASLFGLFLICFNTLIHSVSERLGEFALLKAIGFAPPRLLWLVFLEALLVIVPAAAAGMLCAQLLIHGVAGTKLDLPGIMLTRAAVAESAFSAIGLAIVSSVLPALRIMHVDCAQTLRRG
ncbi:MAG TPA: ABC transporter permease [Steroidobacteraceae bacterium]|nr:ABC transporter permease [Steroidobacteraceae bacterium]